MTSVAVGWIHGGEDDGMSGHRFSVRPVMHRFIDRDGLFDLERVLDYPADTLVRCDATGAAFVLVHRRAFEAVSDRFGYGWWYDRVPNTTDPQQPVSEDYSFCVRLREVGVPVHVHTGVRTSHAKTFYLSEADYERPIT
jgi:hypothetical protein